MGSSRLPGKSLKTLAGKPMIQWVIERLQTIRATSGEVILATGRTERDTPLAEFAESLGVRVFRGSDADVLDRYYRCARAHDLEVIIRATGDNPFVDSEEADRLIDFFFENKLEYATLRTGQAPGYPLGLGVEVMTFDALERSWHEGTAPHHREHVNEFLLEHPESFPQGLMEPPAAKEAAWLSLTVDTEQQFEEAERRYHHFLTAHPGGTISTAWLIQHHEVLFGAGSNEVAK